jgi:hypothetical protein
VFLKKDYPQNDYLEKRPAPSLFYRSITRLGNQDMIIFPIKNARKRLQKIYVINKRPINYTQKGLKPDTNIHLARRNKL